MKTRINATMYVRGELRKDINGETTGASRRTLMTAYRDDAHRRNIFQVHDDTAS